MIFFGTEKATADCISDDALIHLKSYKYSSVDKSPVAKYILGPWVGQALEWYRSGTETGGMNADMGRRSGTHSSKSCRYGLLRIWLPSLGSSLFSVTLHWLWVSCQI